MKLIEKLFSLCNVGPNERKSVTLMLVHSFFIGLAIIFFETAATSLFLSHFDKVVLPYFYLVSALLNAAVGVGYARVKERMSFAKFMLATLLFLLMLVGVFRVGLAATDAGWLLFGLFACKGILVMLAPLEYWAVATQLYDIRQGKRLFSFIGTGEVVAQIAGAACVPVLIPLIGVKNLIFLSGLGLACALGTLSQIFRIFPQTFEASPSSQKPKGTSEKPDIQTHLQHLLQHRYLMLMGGATMMAILGKFFIDFAFLSQVQTRYTDAARLAGFFALFSCVTQVLDFVGRITLSGKFFRRYGIRICLLTLPALHTICTLLMILVGSLFGDLGLLFWLTIINQGLYKTFRYTIDRPSFKVLYQPLHQEQRLTAQIAIEGIITQTAVGTAGLIMLLFSSIIPYNPAQFACVMLCALGSWLFFAYRLGAKGYPSALKDALTSRRLTDTSLTVTDNSTIDVLRQSLESPNAGVVVYALDRLEESGSPEFAAMLTGLLGHPSAEIRLDILQRIERLKITSTLPAIQERLKYEGSTTVRGASLRTIAALGDSEALDEIVSELHHVEPPIQREILVGLLRNGDLEGILAAGEIVIKMVQSSRPGEREFAAQVLGRGGICSFYRPILTLLNDNMPSVQRAALRAAGTLQHPKLWPAMIVHLTKPHIRAAATKALKAGGDAALPQIQNACEQDECPHAVRIRLIRICGHIGGQRATAILSDMLDFPDLQIRSEVSHALVQCGYRADENTIPAIREHLKTEIAWATWTLAAIVELSQHEELSLLTAALHNSLQRHIRHVFNWLSFLYDPLSIRQVKDSLSRVATVQAGDDHKRKRAYALEVLDVLVEPELKTLLIPLLDNLSPQEQLQQLSIRFPQEQMDHQAHIQAILTTPDTWITPWLRACSLHAVAQYQSDDFSEIVVASTSSSFPIVRETALRTLAVVDSAGYRQYLADHPEDVDVLKLKGEKCMLSIFEKIIILKAVKLFADTSEDALTEVAAVLEEVEYQRGETVFQKGELGSSMYVIASGEARVHDQEHTLTTLGEHDVFGELAVLNSEPRSASVTALKETSLLRLDQEPFYEIIEDRDEVARSIIQLLVRRLQRVQLQAGQDASADDILSEIHEKLL